MAPLPAFIACPTSPSDPATTSVAPLRLPTAIDACTAYAGAVSVGGFCTLTDHIFPPCGVIAQYPPFVGVAALPTPTNTESRPFPVVSATDGVESTGTPPEPVPVPNCHSYTPVARLNAYTLPARSPMTTEGPPGSLATLGDDSAIGPPLSRMVCDHVSENDRCGCTAAWARVDVVPHSAPATTATPRTTRPVRPRPRRLETLVVCWCARGSPDDVAATARPCLMQAVFTNATPQCRPPLHRHRVVGPLSTAH